MTIEQYFSIDVKERVINEIIQNRLYGRSFNAELPTLMYARRVKGYLDNKELEFGTRVSALLDLKAEFENRILGSLTTYAGESTNENNNISEDVAVSNTTKIPFDLLNKLDNQNRSKGNTASSNQNTQQTDKSKWQANLDTIDKELLSIENTLCHEFAYKWLNNWDSEVNERTPLLQLMSDDNIIGGGFIINEDNTLEVIDPIISLNPTLAYTIYNPASSLIKDGFWDRVDVSGQFGISIDGDQLTIKYGNTYAFAGLYWLVTRPVAQQARLICTTATGTYTYTVFQKTPYTRKGKIVSDYIFLYDPVYNTGTPSGPVITVSLNSGGTEDHEFFNDWIPAPIYTKDGFEIKREEGEYSNTRLDPQSFTALFETVFIASIEE